MSLPSRPPALSRLSPAIFNYSVIIITHYLSLSVSLSVCLCMYVCVCVCVFHSLSLSLSPSLSPPNQLCLTVDVKLHGVSLIDVAAGVYDDSRGR